MRKIYPDESIFIVESYKNGMSTTELGKLLNRNKCSISGHLKLKGISCRYSNPKLYTLNDHYFDDLNSEGPSYWLGALTADGSINGNRFVLTAKHDDVVWLEQLKDELSYTGPIYTAPSRGYSTNLISRLAISSKHIRQKLQYYGFDNDKTNSAHFCDYVPDNMKRHYIRGLIDGDGSFMYNSKLDKWGISFVGTEKLVSRVAHYLSVTLGVHISVSPHKMIYAFYVGGIEDVKEVAIHLYHNTTNYLPRKKERAEHCLNRYRKTLDRRYINIELINELFGRFCSWDEVASELNIGVTSLYRIRKRLGMETSKEKLCNITKEEILDVYTELGSWNKVAKFYGVSRPTITSRISKSKG